MSSQNQVNLLGRLGRDPEVRHLPDGTATCNLAVATSEAWKDKVSGERKEATEWHRVVLFGRQAEVAGEYCKKGQLVSVTGKLATRKWQDKEGKDTYTTEVRARELRLIPSGEGGGERGQQRSSGTQQRSNGQQPQQQSRSQAAARPATGFDDMDDDIPW